MENVVWRAGITIVLLLAVALAGPRTGHGEPASGSAPAETVHSLSVVQAGDAGSAQMTTVEAYDWTVVDVQRQMDRRIAQLPR